MDDMEPLLDGYDMITFVGDRITKYMIISKVDRYERGHGVEARFSEVGGELQRQSLVA